ncbi:PF04255 family protein [Leptospira noguchii serovar Autumnalis str. ZUN142]|uniref:PF04255 family protein n=1 Tax=Leptospira noguchii serovar Autumnalis str. ZUN142 TaxID=1085540 RepID=M6UWY5_9LEPT|nr:PF04255 family protein [Leptospira noguchii serovar Autumnalis str. ZUN142]
MVEHILGMLAAGDTSETILEGYPWLESEDIQAHVLYMRIE